MALTNLFIFKTIMWTFFLSLSTFSYLNFLKNEIKLNYTKDVM